MSEKIALVLGGGGARGAYEVGALSVLLPWLEEADERPDVIVGTSIGALNAAYLAAHAHEDVTEVLEEGCREWLRIGYRNLLESLWSIGELTAVGRLAASLVFTGIVPSSLLDPAPLVGTVHRLVKVDDIHRNVVAPDVALRACAVVTTAAHTNRSVVFHDGGCNPPADDRRGIDYAPTPITEAHIRASAAIPVAFPAVEVCEPEGSQGWYFDGGTRLSTPIKPALKLGAGRVIVVGLNSVWPAKALRPGERPDLFDGVSQITQGLLVDPTVQDLETLAMRNEVLLRRGAPSETGDRDSVIPYIFVAPEDPNRIGELAGEVYKRRYGCPRWVRRSLSLALLGRFLGASKNSTRGELFSYLFFDPEFAEELIELGRADAERWKQTSHDAGAWQQRALPRLSLAPSDRPERGHRTGKHRP